MSLSGRPKELLECMKIEKLFPPQEEAIKQGVLKGENLIVTSPTASGKTLIAALAIASQVEPGINKAFYTVPLRSIAFEKIAFFKEVSRCLGYKVEMVVGDIEIPDWKIKKADIILSTYEKMDGILRKKPEYLSELAVGVIDELHYVGDPKRGPIIELVASILKDRAPHSQIVGLSATITNAEELAEWLNAKLVKSTWRPVPLKEGVYKNGIIYFPKDEIEPVSIKAGVPSIDLAIHASTKKGQSLVFVQSRRRAVSLARKLAQKHRFLDYDETLAREASKNLLSQTEKSSLSEILSEIVSKGVAFHHAGLSNHQRTIIENTFRNQGINTIVATPTLAAGVNLPARYVIVDEYTRFENGYRTPITVSEYKQLAGRAGRPGYDDLGIAVIVAKPSDDVEELIHMYTKRTPEPVISKLASRKVLRIVLLALVTSGIARTDKSIHRIISSTLYALQSPTSIMEFILDEALNDLVKWDMIVSDNSDMEPTRLGILTSLLYLDPLTSHIIIDYLRKKPKQSSLGIFHLVGMTDDAQTVRITRREVDDLYNILDQRFDELIMTPECCFEDEVRYLQALKTALLLEDWINEASLPVIEEKYGVGPGDVSTIAETYRWLVYSISKLSGLFPETMHLVNFAKNLEVRLKYGVKEEILELTRIKGIGRVRARLLYKHGFKTIEDLKKARIEDLVKIPTIGYLVAREILSQLGNNYEHSERKTVEEEDKRGLLMYME